MVRLKTRGDVAESPLTFFPPETTSIGLLEAAPSRHKNLNSPENSR